MISKHQKEILICTLYKASSQYCKQTTRHWPFYLDVTTCSLRWRALREVDWKLFAHVISILKDFLLGMHGPRYCNDLVCSIYLPIMFQLSTSLLLYLVCQRQSNIFNSFNFVWFHFNHRFLCWKINKIAPPKSFLTCWYIEVFQTFRQRQDITKHALALMQRCSSCRIKMREKLSKKQD